MATRSRMGQKDQIQGCDALHRVLDGSRWRSGPGGLPASPSSWRASRDAANPLVLDPGCPEEDPGSKPWYVAFERGRAETGGGIGTGGGASSWRLARDASCRRRVIRRLDLVPRVRVPFIGGRMASLVQPQRWKQRRAAARHRRWLTKSSPDHSPGLPRRLRP